MTHELPSPDSNPSDDDAILKALESELELNPYDELDWLASSIYRGAHTLETLDVRPDLTITEGRDIPFGHLGQDRLNGELFREADGSYRGSISVASDDPSQALIRISRNPLLGQWLGPIRKREVDGVTKLVRRRYTDNGLLRALEKRWPWDGRYDTDRIRRAASRQPSEFEKDTSAQDLYEIFQTHLLPAAETIRTVTAYQDPRSHTRLEIERILFKDLSSGFLSDDNQFKLSLERTIQAREEGQVVKLVSAAQIDETGNIAVGGYRVNPATGKRSSREIADPDKFIHFLLDGLDKLVDRQAKKPKQSA